MNKLPLLILITLLSLNAQGKNFGKQGNTFLVKEESFIAMMKRKLNGLNLAEHERKMQALVKKRVEEPLAIPGISRATETVSHSFDPSYTLDEDIILPCGKLLFALGETVNPLDHIAWDDNLIFIDGNDSEQVKWLLQSYFGDKKENEEAEDNSNKIILVAGRPFELEKSIQQPTYFDQNGELIKKFNITHVPAVVEQDGKYLKVTEIDIRGQK